MRPRNRAPRRGARAYDADACHERQPPSHRDDASGAGSLPAARKRWPQANETFDSTATFTRTYAALDVHACEAARRTLLSQGYVIGVATAEQVRGRKSFQPARDAHIEVEFNVVCAKEGYAGRRTIAFVNAVQDSFVIKKSNNSASVGVPALGSLSLPFIGSEESLVKVASVTITSAPFYDRFFQLMERYLAGDPGQAMPPAARASDAAPATVNGIGGG